MKVIHSLILLTITAGTLSSCIKNKCGGSDEVQHAYGMEIVRLDDTGTLVKPQGGMYISRLSFQPLTRSEEGERDCLRKNMVISFGESIDTGSLNVYCNIDIKTKGITIPARSNLRKRAEVREGLSGNIEIKMAVADVEPGTAYTYYLEGTTDKATNFTDSLVLYHVR